MMPPALLLAAAASSLAFLPPPVSPSARGTGAARCLDSRVAASRVSRPLACAPLGAEDGEEVAAVPPPSPPPLETYADAEARGFELFQEGAYERAIRMFELAQTLPGDGMDYVREKSGGMIGSATAPPNPRGLIQERFATAEQKMIAQYNIACCYAKLGDTPQTMQILSEYLRQVGEPLNQINEMLVDDDLLTVRDELRELRETFKAPAKTGFFARFKNPLKEAADAIGVEWKD
ncbi:hypothetical protein AB1Y20_011361 [Prymnesium parvum]|uniref:Uncharacterized protein n=1 Tax=Prymnesium parvum TaxID=97485 RepID=A0AB34IPB8_PRYPA|mmetsp:Transcript_19562/g.48862  ORF Transcript_19562/g.48862 Transcript_19562/m.48862 type:complete len:234 (+) Transcript_19562:17-718(+)